MSGSVNKVILIGNLGRDPEIRHLENGSVLGNFSIATTEVYTDKLTGEKKKNVDWHDIIVWNGLAEITEKYIKKGYKIYLEGKLRKRSWQDKDGVTRNVTEIVADEVTILSRPEGSEQLNQKKPNYSNEGTPASPSRIEQLLRDENEDLPF
jgi:single-strand DNA-binding protein